MDRQLRGVSHYCKTLNICGIKFTGFDENKILAVIF